MAIFGVDSTIAKVLGIVTGLVISLAPQLPHCTSCFPKLMKTLEQNHQWQPSSVPSIDLALSYLLDQFRYCDSCIPEDFWGYQLGWCTHHAEPTVLVDIDYTLSTDCLWWYI